MFDASPRGGGWYCIKPLHNFVDKISIGLKLYVHISTFSDNYINLIFWSTLFANKFAQLSNLCRVIGSLSTKIIKLNSCQPHKTFTEVKVGDCFHRPAGPRLHDDSFRL